MSLVVAPLLYFFGVLFAVLPGVSSGIVGIIVSFLSSFYFVSAGWTVYESGRKIADLERNGYRVDIKLLFVFAGKLLEHICWCLMLLLSVFYKYKKPIPDRNVEFLLIEETDQNSNTTSSRLKLCRKICPCPPKTLHHTLKMCVCLKLCVLKCQSKNIPFTPGVARLVSIPFIVFSSLGWCVFTVGFHRLFLDVDPESYYPFSFSVCLILTPLLFLSALLHAAFPGGTGKLMGELAALMHVPFVVFFGYLLIDTGQYLYNICGNFEEDGAWEKQDWLCFDLEDWSSHMHKVYMYVGGITTLVFWSFVVSMWPFYRHDHPRLEDLERLTADMRDVQRMEPELDSESEQRQQQPAAVYGSVQLNGSYGQGSFSNGSCLVNVEAVGQLAQEEPVESGVDGLQQNDDQNQNNQYQDQDNHCQDQVDQQYQENLYEHDLYQEDQPECHSGSYTDSQPLIPDKSAAV